MNDSFEVILNQEEFQKYKLLEKNSEIAEKALRELRRELENYKLKCEQQQLAIRSNELKIKELSKNSIRLSRRLVAEQEEHFNSQEVFLAREKELLEKLLTLSNDHENTTSCLLSTRQIKEKLELENVTLKRKISEQEKQIESLSSEFRQAKKQHVSLSERCTLVEGEFLAVSKECDELKTQMKQLLLESQSNMSKWQERLEANKQAQQDRISQMRQTYEEKIRLSQLKHQDLLEKQAAQISELGTNLHEKSQNFDLLYAQNENLHSNYNSLLAQNKNMFAKFKRLKLSIQSLKKELQDQKHGIELALRNHKMALKMNEDTIVDYIKKLQTAQKQKKQQQINIQSRQNVLAQTWRHVAHELGIIRNQLKKDQIAEEQIILTLQFSRSINQLKMQLDKTLTDYFSSWIK